MPWRAYGLLWLFGLGMTVLIASQQPYPGYMDAAYYFAGGQQLAQGKGFSEPYIWTYLDDPLALPHPSHGYWMPLASILSALGMWLTGHQSFGAGRLIFILLAAFTPPLTAHLAFTLTGRRDIAWMAGFFSLFSGYYASFLPTTDNYSPYMVLGALFFLLFPVRLFSLQQKGRLFQLGVLAGLLNLARSDGLIWLGVASLAPGGGEHRSGKFWRLFYGWVVVMAGFLLIMGPWYVRNWQVYGAPFSPATRRALWLRFYNETFVYPPHLLTPQHLLASGWGEIARARLWALWMNAQTAFAAQGEILLFPLLLIGLRKNCRDGRVQAGTLAWIGLYLAHSLFFPFAGVRGGFFHGGTALQPLWFGLAAIGFEELLRWAARRRRWYLPQAQLVFRPAIVLFLAALTVYLVWVRVFRADWGEGEQYYPAIEQQLVQAGANPQEPVMVLNPPAYYITTGRPAVVTPYAEEPGVLEIARRYGVRYLVLEPDAAALPFYTSVLNSPHFRLIGSWNEIRIFELILE